MRLRVCSLLLLFMPLFIAAKDPTGEGEKAKNPKNVLIYNPYLGHHHIRFMTTIANQLLAEGHKVTMLDSKAMIKPKGFTRAKGMKAPVVIEQSPDAKAIEDNQDIGLRPFWDDLPLTSQLRGFFNFYKLDVSFSPLMSSQCSAILDSKKDMLTLKETKFDLAITEVFDFCGLGIFDILKPTKVILASSVPLHEFIGELLGLPKAFDIIPTKFSTKTMDSLRDKYGPFDSAGFVENAIGSAISGHTMFGSLEANETNIFKKYYAREGLGKFPGIKNLLKNAHSLVENVHPLLDLNKPTLNAIIPIGGITVQDIHTQLDDEGKEQLNTIKAEMEEAKKKTPKVVLVSFGTVMDKSTMKQQTVDNIVDALEGVEEATFFWYIDDPDLKKKLEDKNSNVKPKDWLPQEQLLASGEVDLFVSHMGIGSMTEGAYNGVPFVSVPLFVDQHYNYVCAKRLGIAKFVDKASLAESPAALRDAIQAALKDSTMKDKSDKLKKRLKTFGNQTKTMIDHINFIVSLDGNDPPTFEHHHHGFTLSHSLRSLVHLAPYYAGPVAIIAILIVCAIVAACVMLCSLLCCDVQLNQPFDGFVRTTWAFFLCCYAFFGFFYPACLYIADYYNQTNGCIFIVAVVFILLISPCALNRYLDLNYEDVLSKCAYVAGVIFWFTLTAVCVFALAIVVLYTRLFFVYNW